MPSFDRSLADLARERRAFLGALDAMTPAQRAFRPAPDAWSPTEIVEHLVRVERGILTGVERQLAAGDARKELGPRSAARVMATFAAMRTPARFRVPEGAAKYVAPQGEPYEALREEWAGLEARWRAAASALTPALERAALLQHPRAGPITLADAAHFCAVHAAHHRGQLERTTRAARFADA